MPRADGGPPNQNVGRVPPATRMAPTNPRTCAPLDWLVALRIEGEEGLIRSPTAHAPQTSPCARPASSWPYRRLPPNSWTGPRLIRIDADVGLSGSKRQRLPEDRRKWYAVRRPLAGRSSALNQPPGPLVDQDVGDDGRPGWPDSAAGGGVSVGQFFQLRSAGGRGQKAL